MAKQITTSDRALLAKGLARKFGDKVFIYKDTIRTEEAKRRAARWRKQGDEVRLLAARPGWTMTYYRVGGRKKS